LVAWRNKNSVAGLKYHLLGSQVYKKKKQPYKCYFR